MGTADRAGLRKQCAECLAFRMIETFALRQHLGFCVAECRRRTGSWGCRRRHFGLHELLIEIDVRQHTTFLDLLRGCRCRLIRKRQPSGQQDAKAQCAYDKSDEEMLRSIHFTLFFNRILLSTRPDGDSPLHFPSLSEEVGGSPSTPRRMTPPTGGRMVPGGVGVCCNCPCTPPGGRRNVRSCSVPIQSRVVPECVPVLVVVVQVWPRQRSKDDSVNCTAPVGPKCSFPSSSTHLQVHLQDQ